MDVGPIGLVNSNPKALFKDVLMPDPEVWNVNAAVAFVFVHIFVFVNEAVVEDNVEAIVQIIVETVLLSLSLTSLKTIPFL